VREQDSGSVEILYKRVLILRARPLQRRYWIWAERLRNLRVRILSGGQPAPDSPLIFRIREIFSGQNSLVCVFNSVWQSKFLMAVNGGARVSTVAARQIVADSLSFATKVFG